MAKQDKKQESIVPETTGQLAQYGQFAGMGFEGTTSDDLKTPFIKQLQGLSPEITDGMEGAKLGMFYNTATGELIPMEKGFTCVPVSKIHHYVEWRQREAGGGFVGTHAVNSPVVNKAIALNGGNKFGKLKTPAFDKDGKESGMNELHESHDIFLMLLNDEGTKPTGETAVMAFTSTKIKAIRNWWTKMYTLKLPNLPNGDPAPRPPLFAFRTRIVGFKDPRQQKGVFFNVQASPLVEGSWLDSLCQTGHEAILQAALGYYEAFAKGAVKPDYESQKNATAEAEGEEVPF